jgi:hypothetical protein
MLSKLEQLLAFIVPAATIDDFSSPPEYNRDPSFVQKM